MVNCFDASLKRARDIVGGVDGEVRFWFLGAVPARKGLCFSAVLEY